MHALGFLDSHGFKNLGFNSQSILGFKNQSNSSLSLLGFNLDSTSSRCGTNHQRLKVLLLRQVWCARLTDGLCRPQRTGTLWGEAQLGPAGLPWDWHRVPAKGNVSCWTPHETLETLKLPEKPARASLEAPRERDESADARRRQLLKSASVELDAWHDAGRQAAAAAAPGAVDCRRARAVRFSDGPAEPGAEGAASRAGAASPGSSRSAGAEPGAQGPGAATASAALRGRGGERAGASGQAAEQMLCAHDLAPADAGRASAIGGMAEQGGCGPSPQGGLGEEPRQLDGWLAAAAALADSRRAAAPRPSAVSPFAETPPSAFSSAADSRQSSVTRHDAWAGCSGAPAQPDGPSTSHGADWGLPLDDADALGAWYCAETLSTLRSRCHLVLLTIRPASLTIRLALLQHGSAARRRASGRLTLAAVLRVPWTRAPVCLMRD